MRCSCRKERFSLGFTMMEIMVVLVIIIAIMGITIPAVSNVGRMQASAELGKFNSFVKKMFMKAVRTSQYMRVVVNMETGEYWAEKTDAPFFIISGEGAAAYQQELKKSLDAIGDEEDTSGTGGSAAFATSLMDLMMAKEQGESESDLYNWENFVPQKKSLKELFKPNFESVGKKMKIPSSLMWTMFYAYHTPEIITQQHTQEEKTVSIFLFPQGRSEPFYIGLGDEEDTYAHLSSDFFLSTKITRGGFGEEVKEMQDYFEEKEEEGK